MQNRLKIVFRPSSNGWYVADSGTLFTPKNDRASAMLDVARLSNLDFMKYCRGIEIFELYKDKHNNYIYREYEKN